MWSLAALRSVSNGLSFPKVESLKATQERTPDRRAVFASRRQGAEAAARNLAETETWRGKVLEGPVPRPALTTSAYASPDSVFPPELSGQFIGLCAGTVYFCARSNLIYLFNLT